MNVRVGRVGRLVAPSYGQCLRCSTPWRFVEPHVLAPIGRIVLCEKCWGECSVDERLGYYRFDWHRLEHPSITWEALEAAIRSESRGAPFKLGWIQPRSPRLPRLSVRYATAVSVAACGGYLIRGWASNAWLFLGFLMLTAFVAILADPT